MFISFYDFINKIWLLQNLLAIAFAQKNHIEKVSLSEQKHQQELNT